MRAFCLLLILANALFFGWAQLIDVNRSPLDAPRTAAATPPPRIVLAREAGAGEAEPRTEVKPIEPPRVAPVPPVAPQDSAQRAVASAPGLSSCVSVGPFAELADSAQAQTTIRAAGLEPRQRIELGEIWVGYWVSVRDLASRAEADAALAVLTQHGIGDAYILPGSEGDYVLSVGVFSDYKRAQRRAAEIRARGLEPQVVDRKRAGSVYWIDVNLGDTSQTLDMSMFQSAPGKITRLELRACPAEGQG